MDNTFDLPIEQRLRLQLRAKARRMGYYKLIGASLLIAIMGGGIGLWLN